MASSASSFASPAFEIEVIRRNPELLPPTSPTPHGVKLLSDIDDQDTLRFQLPIILFYPKGNGDDGHDHMKTIRRALAEALVPYYPLAGRIREGSGKKLSVDCTGEGILFTEAEADVTLEQLGEWIRPPCPWLEEFMHDVPGSSSIVGTPLLLVQVTRLACGGLVVAVRLNHTVIDGLGISLFLNKVAEIARGDTPGKSQLPVWQREILMARNPPRVTCTHHEYDDVPHTAYSYAVANDINSMVRASIFFGPKELASLRRRLPPRLSAESSRFEVITACMWRCRTAALELDPEEVVRLLFPVNARGLPDFKVPDGFYGNTFALPAVLSKTGQLTKNPLGYALELVRTAKAKMSKEYIQSTADLIATRRRPGCTRVWNFMVSDASKAGLDQIDFGWGRPAYGGPGGPLPLISPYGRYKNKRGEVGVVVPLWLPPTAMFRLRKELVKMTNQVPLAAIIKSIPGNSIPAKL